MENAEAIALHAQVFVRKARAAGHSNLITELLLQETAQVLGLTGDDYSLRTVKRLALANARTMGETHLLSFNGGTS
jgi:hypothetical protein